MVRDGTITRHTGRRPADVVVYYVLYKCCRHYFELKPLGACHLTKGAIFSS